MDAIKGKGKRPPPPVAKGVGKGKGKGPAAPPPRAVGEAKPSQALLAPPKELLAPAGSALLPLRHPLASAEGSMWEGLDPWGAAGHGVLEGAEVELELIRGLWGPIPAPPWALRRAAREGLPAKLLQPVEIAVKARGLDAELVQRGLTEDALALTPEQAEALHTVVVPTVQDAEPHLRIIVNRQGVAALSRAEAVLWAIANIPLAEVRALLVMEQHHVDDAIAQVQGFVDAADAASTALKDSSPVRTVLQMILAVRNILGQRGHAGYVVPKTFEDLPRERVVRPQPLDPETGMPMAMDLRWFQEHNPSVLTLVAEMLEATHERRCRLRFLRLLAVGRLLKVDHVRRSVWSYLDDLQESPRDALAVLCGCSSGLCNREVLEDISRQAMKFRQLATHELHFLRRHRSFVPQSTFGRQVEAMAVRFAEALQTCDDCCRSIAETAAELCRLGGCRAVPAVPASFDGAGEVLRSLRLLGTRLGTEMCSVSMKRREKVLAGSPLVAARGERSKVRRRWALVDTSGHALVVTSDLDIIRRLRWRPTMEVEEPGGPAGPSPASEAGARGSEAARKREETVRAFNDMVHGGAEGVYRRDPLTGKWGRRLDGVDGTSAVEIRLGGPRADL